VKPQQLIFGVVVEEVMKEVFFFGCLRSPMSAFIPLSFNSAPPPGRRLIESMSQENTLLELI